MPHNVKKWRRFGFAGLGNALSGEGQVYSIFTVIDISHEQRRRALERIFFHDVLNTAGGLRGFAELMQDSTPEEIDELSETVLEISEELINEIQAQRDLASAESGDLQSRNRGTPGALPGRAQRSVFQS